MLTDFGLSKKGVTDGVLNKSFCGSPAYLPPEILSRQGLFGKISKVILDRWIGIYWEL